MQRLIGKEIEDVNTWGSKFRCPRLNLFHEGNKNLNKLGVEKPYKLQKHIKTCVLQVGSVHVIIESGISTSQENLIDMMRSLK